MKVLIRKEEDTYFKLKGKNLTRFQTDNDPELIFIEKVEKVSRYISSQEHRNQVYGSVLFKDVESEQSIKEIVEETVSVSKNQKMHPVFT